MNLRRLTVLARERSQSATARLLYVLSAARGGAVREGVR
jgi:hypothetical protein